MSVGLLGAAITVIVLRFDDLERSIDQLTRVSPGWVLLAVAAEGGSMLAFGRLQQRLLRAGGTAVALPPMVAITTASNAITGTLPGGVAWAAAWLYDQLGSRGVPRFLRVWMFLVAGGVSSFGLFVVIVAGVEVAGSRGPVASLRWLAFLLALIPIGALLIEAFRSKRPVRFAVQWAESQVANEVPGGRRLLEAARSLVARFTAVRLGPLGWIEVLVLALTNWLLDCVVLVASMVALGVSVPWTGILVVYGLTQISVSLPLTPGGIGVVDGSMIALLHAYGVGTSDALAAVLLYRIVSFWIVVPIGWGVWSGLEAVTRQRVHAISRAGARQSVGGAESDSGGGGGGRGDGGGGGSAPATQGASVDRAASERQPRTGGRSALGDGATPTHRSRILRAWTELSAYAEGEAPSP